jgi:hypothetical protein
MKLYMIVVLVVIQIKIMSFDLLLQLRIKMDHQQR